jgi:hypothetical protein
MRNIKRILWVSIISLALNGQEQLSLKSTVLGSTVGHPFQVYNNYMYMGEMNGNMVLQHNQAQHNLSYKSKQRQKEFWTVRTTLTRVRMPNPDPEEKWTKLCTKNAEQRKDGEKLGQSPYSRITNERYHMYLWGTKSPGLFVRTINAEGKEESFRRVAELSKECGAVRMEFSKSEDDSHAAFCAYVCNERKDKYRQDAYDVELIVMDEDHEIVYQEVISNMPDIGMLNFAQMLFAEERLYVLGYQYYREGRKKSKKNPLIEQKRFMLVSVDLKDQSVSVFPVVNLDRFADDGNMALMENGQISIGVTRKESGKEGAVKGFIHRLFDPKTQEMSPAAFVDFSEIQDAEQLDPDSDEAKSDRFKMSTLGKRNFSYKGFLKLKNINLSFTTSLATPPGGRYDILEWTRSIKTIDKSDGTEIGNPRYYHYGSMIVYSNPQGEPEYIENIYREFSDDREWEYMGAGAWYGTVGNDLVMAFPDNTDNGEFYSGRLEKLKFVRNSTANVVRYIRLTEEGQLANTAFEFPENQYFNLNSSLSMNGFRFGSAPLKAVFSGTMVGFNIGWHNILLELE